MGIFILRISRSNDDRIFRGKTSIQTQEDDNKACAYLKRGSYVLDNPIIK